MSARLARGIGANVYGQSVTLAIQLVSVPGFLHAWGSPRYGLWLLLCAMPSALSFADGGMTVAAGNAMTMAVARGDVARAAAIFAASRLVLQRVTAAIAAGACVIILVIPDAALPAATLASPTACRTVLMAMVGVVLAGLNTSLISAGLRANGDYASGVATTDTIRLAESTAALCAATLGGDLAIGALALLATRLVGLVIFAACAKRRAPWLAASTTAASRDALRPLIRPALASLAVPAGFAVSLQGATIVVGATLPLNAVTAFVATRTLVRTLVQAVGLFNHALMPEVSTAAGRRDAVAMAALVRLNLRVVALTLPLAWVGLVVLGPAVLRRWTAADLPIPQGFVAIMATAALCHGVWLSMANLLLAANRPGDYAYAFLAVAAASCLVTYPLASVLGLDGAALGGLAGECAMAAWVIPKIVGPGRVIAIAQSRG